MFLSSSWSPQIVKAEDATVFLGGYPAGFTIYQKGAHIVGICDVITGEHISSPAKDAGLQVGDILLYINDVEVNNAKDISENISDGKEKIIKIQRDNQSFITKIKPQKDNLGEYKIGIFVKEGINGIGTITFFTDNRIACLGHPILNDNNSILNLSGGKVYACNITGAIKGVRGRPGELRGVFDEKNLVAKIDKNDSFGVFGEVKNLLNYKLQPIKVGIPSMGSAYIVSTTEGCEPKKYSISIIKSDLNKEDRNLVIRIDDKNLLEKTNGIVQGMSGSPIIQNGKLVGAVTHVFINDPTKGFGISIDKMLNR